MFSRKRDEGYVLVLAMAVLLVLSGIGLYALRTSRVELRASSNLRMGAQAEYVSEAALQQAIGQIMANPALFLARLQGGGGRYEFPNFAGLFGESAGGGDGGTATTYDALGKGTAVVPTTRVVVSRAIDVSPSIVPGYMIGSVGGTTVRIRLKRVDISALGTLAPPVTAANVDGGVPDQRTASSQVLVHALIGPL